MSYWLHRHNIRYELLKKKERFLMWIAFHLPRSVTYWAAINVGAHATTGAYENQVMPELTYVEALKRWGLHQK